MHRTFRPPSSSAAARATRRPNEASSDSEAEPIRVITADDHPVIRAGIRDILATTTDLSVVAEAGDGEELLELLRSEPVDVLLLDINMPGPSFSQLLTEVRRLQPELPILVLSIHPEEQYAIQVLRQGVSGYLAKNKSPDKLVEAVRVLAQGRRYVSQSVAELLLQSIDDPSGESRQTEAPRLSTLTEREVEVLALLGQGHSTKQVARQLHVSPKTIATHRMAIRRKLGIDSSAALIRYCLINGIEPL